MTEAEWLVCIDPQKMLEFLRGKASDRKLRLFAVACCRSILHLLEVHRREVEQIAAVAERFADGLAAENELRTTRDEYVPWDYENFAAIQACHSDALQAARNAVRYTSAAILNCWTKSHPQHQGRRIADHPAKVAYRAMLSEFVRDIFDSPFRPVAFNPTWLVWNDGTVQRISQAIYDERAFDRLPILADALEEAGCTNQDILAHCRQPAEHVRGCWVVDRILGKE